MDWLLIPLFAILNRFAGGGFTQPQGPIPQFGGLLRRPIYVISVSLLNALPLIYGWPGFWIAVGYIAYREPGWRVIFKAELDYRRIDHPGPRMFARSLFAAPAMLALPLGPMQFVAFFYLCLFAILAVFAYQVGNWAQARWPRENTVMQFAEPLAGLFYGYLAVTLLAFGSAL